MKKTSKSSKKSPKTTRKKTKKPNKLLTVAAVGLIFGLVGVAYMALTSALRDQDATDWYNTKSLHYRFNDDSLSRQQLKIVDMAQTTSLTRQAEYRPFNVAIRDGSLHIYTRRHCTQSQSETLSTQNASTKPCPANTVTRYSTGRLETLGASREKLLSGSFRVVWRAKMPVAVNGTRSALWLVNNNPQSLPLGGGYCSTDTTSPRYHTNLSEFDVLEWYGAMPYKTTATSHITCTGGKTKNAGPRVTYSNAWSTQWHTWTLEYNTRLVRYFVDGKLIATHVGKNLPNQTRPLTFTTPDWEKSTQNMQWHMIMQGEVFRKKIPDDCRLKPSPSYPQPGKCLDAEPDARRDFPTQDMVIDYLKVFTHT